MAHYRASFAPTPPLPRYAENVAAGVAAEELEHSGGLELSQAAASAAECSYTGVDLLAYMETTPEYKLLAGTAFAVSASSGTARHRTPRPDVHPHHPGNPGFTSDPNPSRTSTGHGARARGSSGSTAAQGARARLESARKAAWRRLVLQAHPDKFRARFPECHELNGIENIPDQALQWLTSSAVMPSL